ncbi:recombinase family protein [Streptomyces sp. NPDC002688]|uniref:recombinase family protein n=1 Tax=Streptomyces sp. NPDC002688 TaxID=3154423 RepID=UPI003317BF67
MVVRLRADGARLADICNDMNAAGIPTPGGGSTWWPSYVHRLLRTRDGEKQLARARGEAAAG